MLTRLMAPRAMTLGFSEQSQLSASQRRRPLVSQQHVCELRTSGWALILKKIAENRGCLKRGGAIDASRAESLLLRDFRQGKLGRLSFDYPIPNDEF